MINAKILSSTSTFNAIKYNDGKTKSRDNKPETGKLLALRNFAGMETTWNWSVSDLKAYFKSHGSINKRIKNQQFHAVLSVKEKALDEKQLENAAHQYLLKMGYADIPYIIYFHSDTANNHVHIVSSRVGQDGKKINAAFEKQRSLEMIKEISKQFGFSIPQDFEVAKNLAFKFKFSSDAQFNLLMEIQGFKFIADTTGYEYIQNGKKAGRVEKDNINNAMIEHTLKVQGSESRIKQIRALIYKYAPEYSPTVNITNDKLPGQREKIRGENSKGKFDSELSRFLKDKFGIDIIYHGSIEKGKPYGYSLIDNPGQNIFKGSDIFSLQKLMDAAQLQPVAAQLEKTIDSNRKTDQTYSETGSRFLPVNENSNNDTKEQFFQKIDDLYKELTFFADSGEELPTHSNKKKRKNSNDLDLER